jgi:mannosyl-oligosaccharide glucosidase
MKLNKKYENCSAAAAEKIFDGLSYEYGTLRIKNGNESISNLPTALLSFCPSRKRFPWGFLWDDGFHCEVASRKDDYLALKVIKSWLDTMLDDGWIPREQNRGD